MPIVGCGGERASSTGAHTPADMARGVSSLLILVAAEIGLSRLLEEHACGRISPLGYGYVVMSERSRLSTTLPAL